MDEDRLGLTEEQWKVFRHLTQGFPQHNEDGVDLSLLRENLRLTPLERLRKLQRELASLQALGHVRDAGL